MTNSESILLHLEGAVAHVRFNRPQVLNVIDADMATKFLAVCRGLADDPGIRAVVLSGEGKGFMAGGDLFAMQSRPDTIAYEIIEPLHGAMRLLAAIDAAVIASVHGVVAGAGMSLALNADFVIAAEGTRFNLAYINIGASSDGGASFALPRIVGLRRALEIALLSETFDAAEAQRLNIVSRVVPVQERESAVATLANRLAAGPTRAIGQMRRLMRQSFDNSFSNQLNAEQAAFQTCTTTGDFREGLQAFIEKRPVRFVGA